MAVTNGSFKFYNSFREYLCDSTIDLDTDTFKITLHTSTYGALDTTHIDDHAVYADLTNELATANGYTNGGLTLTGVTWARTGATVAFDSADPSWTITGSSITARYYVIRKVGTANGITDPLVAVGYLDSTPVDVTVAAGSDLTILVDAAGWFTLG
jgi:hypothetical protein